VLTPGDILHIYCPFIRPKPKYKYAVCVCADPNRFFFISTNPRTREPDAQVLIDKSKLSFLKKASYINTAQMVTFAKDLISRADNKGALPSSIISTVRETVNESKYLSPLQKKQVLDSLKFVNA